MNSSVIGPRGVHDLCIWTENEDLWVAAALADAHVKVWGNFSNCCLAELKGHSDQVTCVKCSPDGRFLASASLDLTVCIWTLQPSAPAAWQSFAVLKSHKGRVTSLCFTPNSGHLLTGSTDTTSRVWCCNSWKCVGTLQGHRGIVTALGVSSCSQWAASASGDGTCLLWHLSSGVVKHKLEADSGDEILWCICFRVCLHGQHETKTTSAILEQQGRVLLWDLSVAGQNWVDGTILGPFKAINSFAGKILAIIFTAAEQDRTNSTAGFQGLMAIACADGTLQVIDTADYTVTYSLSISERADLMHQPWSRNRSQAEHIILAAFSACGTWLATVGLTSCSEVQIWEAETGALTGSSISSASAVKAIKWALDKGSRHTLVLGDVTGDCSFHFWECSSTGPEPDRRRLGNTHAA